MVSFSATSYVSPISGFDFSTGSIVSWTALSIGVTLVVAFEF